MPSQGLQVMGVMLGVIGWLGTIITCALPMWKVTAFFGVHIITARVVWEGLWMNCVMQSTGQMQCKIYDSVLALPQDLRAARAMVIISVVVGVFGIITAVIGGKCTKWLEDEVVKAKVSIVSGVIFITCGLLIIIPVSWSASSVSRDFYNPLLIDAQRRELGAALYVGWASGGLLLLGGSLLCRSCPPNSERRYTSFRYVSSNANHV